MSDKNSIGGGITVVGFLSIALIFSADYEGGVDLLDAVIEYVQAETIAIEIQNKESK